MKKKTTEELFNMGLTIVENDLENTSQSLICDTIEIAMEHLESIDNFHLIFYSAMVAYIVGVAQGTTMKPTC